MGERKRIKDVRLEMLQDNSSLARNKIAEHLLSLNVLNEGDKTGHGGQRRNKGCCSFIANPTKRPSYPVCRWPFF